MPSLTDEHVVEFVSFVEDALRQFAEAAKVPETKLRSAVAVTQLTALFMQLEQVSGEPMTPKQVKEHFEQFRQAVKESHNASREALTGHQQTNTTEH